MKEKWIILKYRIISFLRKSGSNTNLASVAKICIYKDTVYDCTMYYTSLKLELQTNNAWNSRLTEDCGVEGLFWAAVEQFTLIVFWHFRAESVKQVWTLTLQPLFSRHESECRNCGYGLLGIFLWNFSVVP